MSAHFCLDGAEVVCGPRSYINHRLGEDIRHHTIRMIKVAEQDAVYHSRLHAIVICTDEDVFYAN